MNRNLLITCIDETDTDKPDKWISDKAEYDIVFLCYSQNEDFINSLVEYGRSTYLVRSGKWKNIRTYLYEKGLGQYEFFWFPDPDLEISIDDINLLFDFVTFFDLGLSQPSLTKDSFCFWHFLKNRENSILRPVKLVEVMCPCFSREILKKLLWTFNFSYSGYGLDFIWAQYQQGFVIDVVKIRHPRMANFHQRASEKGFPDPSEEMSSIKQYLGLK